MSQLLTVDAHHNWGVNLPTTGQPDMVQALELLLLRRIMFCDIAMIVLGLFGAVTVGKYKWG